MTSHVSRRALKRIFHALPSRLCPPHITLVLRKFSTELCCCLLLLSIIAFFGETARAARIIHISSYNAELPWTAGINNGVLQILGNHPEIELKTFYMDTKRHPSPPEIKAIALQAKNLIEQWHPDLIISSDDNAAQYLIVPYFKNGTIPVVFCGINWSATEYGFPCSNVTGMIEVQLVDQIINQLRPYARGDHIGFLKGDDFSARKEAEYFEKTFHLQLEKRFVTNFTQWQEEYLALQNDVDMLLLGNPASVADWDPTVAQFFINEHTRIPSGNWDPQLAPYALITIATVAEEQGIWAAQTALSILAGTAPASIPLTTNKEAHTIVNMMLARQLDIHFPMALLESAKFISAIKPRIAYVNSYHKGYLWSDEIEKNLLRALKISRTSDDILDDAQSKVTLKILRLDTKLERSEERKKQAALQAWEEIDTWQPDVVVVSDDNAVRYLVVPYLKDRKIPTIFCGVNVDARDYDLPADHITGMIEQDPVADTIAMLKQLAKGERVGFIGADNFSNTKLLASLLKADVFSSGRLVETFQQWQEEYLRLQNSADLLIWFSPFGIKNWNEEKAMTLIRQYTTIPTGTTNPATLSYVLLGRTPVPGEFGWWAGTSALRIVNGEPVTNIPVTTNTSSRSYLNMTLARELGIVFPMEMINEASFWETTDTE